MTNFYRLLILWFLVAPFCICGLELTLVTSAYCAHSPIPCLGTKDLLYVGERSRFSTCTAVAWFPDQKHLISANLIASTMQTFQFDENFATLHPLQFFSSAQGTKLMKPEHLAFSSDGTLMGVANGNGGILTFYKVNGCQIHPIPVAIIKEAEKTKFHSIRFSSDDRFLAYVNNDKDSRISIAKIHRKGKKLSFSPSYSQAVSKSLNLMKSKGIAFSPDQKWVAVCYSRRAAWTPNKDYESAVEIYAFDSISGTIDPIPAGRTTAHLCVTEDILFDPLQPYLYVSNQGNDTITVHEYDPHSGAIQDTLHNCLKNPEAALSFPHGISITKDGRFLASSNYGDNKVTVYSIHREDQ